MSLKPLAIDLALINLENILREYPNLAYKLLVAEIEIRSICSHSVAKSAITKMSEAGHVISTGKRVDGYCWSDTPIFKTDVQRFAELPVLRPTKKASECKPAILTSSNWTSLLAVCV